PTSLNSGTCFGLPKTFKTRKSIGFPGRQFLFLCPSSVSGCFCCTLDADDVCCKAHINLAFVMEVIDLIEGFSEFELKFLIDFVLIPVIALVVLHPLEVGHCHTACGCKHIGNDELAVVGEDFCRFFRSRTVCRLTDDIRFDIIRVLFCDLVGNCCRDQDITVDFKQFMVAQDVIEQICHHAKAVTAVQQVVYVESVRIMPRTVRICNLYDVGTFVRKDLGQETSCTSKSLYYDADIFHLHITLFHRLFETQDNPHRCCTVASLRAAQHKWFTCNESRRVEFVDHAVLIHHPRHYL